MNFRSNEEWLQALGGPAGEARRQALRDLRNYLLRAALVYLSQRRSELAHWSRDDVYELAEDLSQEALMKILASLDTFRGESKFTSWAYRFVINLAASELRRHRYRDVSLDRLMDEAEVELDRLVRGPRAISPGRAAEQRAYLELLREIVETELSDRQRTALVAVYWQGRSMDEVAAALGITRNALYKLLHDARKRLKARLLARRLTLGDILAAFE